ncbi:hypothetical protein pb186bvf_004701 [Paramecium bursaria]
MLNGNERKICPHYSRVLLQRSLPRIKQEIEKLQSLHKKQNIKCNVCNSKLEYPNICLKCQMPVCDYEKQCMHDHAHHYGTVDHCININIFTTLIICTQCKTEILDFEQYGLTGNEEVFNQWVSPQRLRIEYHRYFYKQEINMIKPNSSHQGILNIGNCSFINAVLQVVLNFPTIQIIFEKISPHYINNINHFKSLRKKFITQLCYISETFRQKQSKIINPTELIKCLSQLDNKQTGYSRKDAYDFFKFLVNILHEEFKFINNKEYSSREIKQNKLPLSHDWDIMYYHIQQFKYRNEPENYKDYSFIQNIFSGDLKSIVQCQQCKKSTTCLETYLAISLEIPEAKQEGFLSKLVQGLKFQNEKRTVTLKECLDFFYEPIQDQFTQCVCGFKGGQRQYMFYDQSNLLCIHIQRFIDRYKKDQTHVEFPLDYIDFSPYLNLKGQLKYQLFAVIVHIKSHGGDHFETILNLGNQQFVSIRDEIVRSVNIQYVQQAEASMLFYQKLPEEKLASLKHNIKTSAELVTLGEINPKDDNLCFIPNFWVEQLLTLGRPCNLITSHYLCIHNQLRPDYWDFRQYFEQVQSVLNQSVYDVSIGFFQNDDKPELPVQMLQKQSSAYQQLTFTSSIIQKEIGQFLIEKYGGGPLLSKSLQLCQICLENAHNMSKRRKLERLLIQKYEDPNDQRIYVINEEWFKQWQSYLYNSKNQLQKNFILGYPPPKEINNSNLQDVNLNLKKEGVHYSLISNSIWKILIELYGGGPSIVIKQVQDKPKIEADDLDTIKELKQIYIQCIREKQ